MKSNEALLLIWCDFLYYIFYDLDGDCILSCTLNVIAKCGQEKTLRKKLWKDISAKIICDFYRCYQ